MESIDNNMIPDLTGEHYLSFLRYLHENLRPKTYLEVGTCTGDSLALSRAASIAIDPRFLISNNVVGDKPLCLLFQMSSDSFFHQYRPSDILGMPIELAFLDGFHIFEFLLRDFINVEKSARKNSVICLHDCIPSDVYMAARDENDLEARNRSRHPGAWTGDVWKAAVILKTHRPDLRIWAVNAKPTGLVLITNLNPNSTYLHERYFEVIEELRDVTLAQYGLRRYIDLLNMQDTSTMQKPTDLWKYFWI